MPDTLTGLKGQGLPIDRWALSPADTLKLISEIVADADMLYKKIARLEAAQVVSSPQLPRPLLHCNRLLGTTVYNLRLEIHETFGKHTAGSVLPASSDPTGQVWFELARSMRESKPSP